MKIDKILDISGILFLGIMAEWFKAADLSSAIFGCAGSNPADTNFSSIGQVVKASDC